MERGASKNVTRAKNILRGQKASPEEILALTKQLKGEKAFDYARRILARARSDPKLKNRAELAKKLAQQHALCTYKDPNLSAEIRFDDALEILWEVEELSTTRDQETLGIAGAIYKYKWEAYGQKQYLESALAYYFRGYQEGSEHDYGYTGINAAYVLDLLANIESTEAKKTGIASKAVRSRRQEARGIREDLVSKLLHILEDTENQWLEKKWWFLVTVAESYLGIENYQEARLWLNKAVALPGVPDWEKETTARQLASLAYLHAGDSATVDAIENTEAWDVLKTLLGSKTIRTAFLGKVGLALSGGGFRASLFHIGVLAKLAELDMLRHVEVLSCVSGGSIIGAHYYLKVRKLLNETPDENISHEDYIKIVEELTNEFLQGVQRDIRTRVAVELLTNLKMIFLPNYSRTLRIGELYEKEIFSKVKDGEGHLPRWLNKLFIKPCDEPEDFSPKYHNWRRAAKVPILILNATSLNTGHNWQFTASWMGEPPAGIDAEIDANPRLRRLYFNEAPEDHKNFRLGYAVAASSCVPGLFEPVNLARLYPNMTVRLVDGGVHDNQGAASLIEQDCSVMLVSDASGQMEEEKQPSGGIIGVPLRSNNILMARVREEEYHNLDGSRRSSTLKDLMFVHLKKGLDVDPVSWITCQDPPEVQDEKRIIERHRPLTRYGIQKDIQRALADIRTDLDTFSDAEAYALMTSAYYMTGYEFVHSIERFHTPVENRPKWRFLCIEKAMKKEKGCETAHSELLRLLKVSKHRAFKIWRLSLPLKIIGWILLIGMLGGFFRLCWKWAPLPILTLGTLGSAIAAIGLGFIVGKTIARIAWFRETLARIGIGIAMSLFGWMITLIHLHIFDRWYLRLGSVDRFTNS
jgi:predicted acylesterase/phospholipase RssA